MSLVVALVGTVLLGTAATAGAKVLPVVSLEVLTSNPTVGQPFEVVMRFGEGFDMPDTQLVEFEVVILPGDQTYGKGWPIYQNFKGEPVSLRRIGTSRYRGSALVDRPGDYVVVARSSVFAHEGGFRNATTDGDYAGPVKLRIGDVARSAAATASRRADPSSAVVAWSAVAAFLAIALGTAVWMTRARSRRIPIASLPDA